MDRPRTHGTPGPQIAAEIVLAMLAMIAIPAAIALHSVETPATVDAVSGASPHGYTWSLLLFIVPILMIGSLHELLSWDTTPQSESLRI